MCRQHFMPGSLEYADGMFAVSKCVIIPPLPLLTGLHTHNISIVVQHMHDKRYLSFLFFFWPNTFESVLSRICILCSCLCF